jgi:hypothetical protein
VNSFQPFCLTSFSKWSSLFGYGWKNKSQNPAIGTVVEVDIKFREMTSLPDREF